MNRSLLASFCVSFAACSHCAPEPAPVQAFVPRSLAESLQSRDWSSAPGETLDNDFATDVNTVLRDSSRGHGLSALGDAGYECIFGEAHADYPEPTAQCTRSFATRACQFDWVVYLSTDPAVPDEIDSLETGFRRDCVGTANDWPEPVVSAIDDQLAPSDRH